MPVLRVHHTTTYSYRRPVSFGEHRLLHRPRDSQDQRLISSTLLVSPEPSNVHWVFDAFGNCVTVVNFDQAASELRFETDMVIDHTPQRGPHPLIEREARWWPMNYGPDILPDLEPSMRVHYPDPSVEQWARQFLDPSGKTETGQLLMTMNKAVRETCQYSRRTDAGTQRPALTLLKRSGTCRDFALLMMEATRTLGFAARFVTGYLYVPSRATNPHLGGGATHAWVKIFLPGAGWVEFDPTNGIVGSEDLIRVAVARDPSQAKPLSGGFIGDRADYVGMTVTVNVLDQPELEPAGTNVMV